MSDAVEKNRYWWAVMYPENMREGWEDDIAFLLQHPFAYCVHDKDTTGHNGDRKKHLHLIICWQNNTTYKAAFRLFERLNAEGKKAFNKIEAVQNIGFAYDYLIHDTEDAKKKGKFQYPKEERIEGNNFDIGAYEQISTSEKRDMQVELSKVILEKNIMDYAEWFQYVIANCDKAHIDVALSSVSHFEKLCKANFHRARRKYEITKRQRLAATLKAEEQLAEGQRLSNLRVKAELIQQGMDPETGELIEEGLPFI